MMLKKSTENITEQRINRLILELDTMSHNGLPAECDREKIASIAQHAIAQCPEKYRKQFAEKAVILIKTRFHYQDIEKQLILSSRLEKNIIQQLRARIKDLARNSVKTAGFTVQWGWQYATRLVKTVLEPVVTQTTLSFSLIVQPIPEPGVIIQNAHTEVERTKTEITTTVQHIHPDYSELVSIQPYEEETIDALISSVSLDNYEKQKPGKQKITVQRHNTLNASEIRRAEPLVLDVERGRMEPLSKMNRKKVEVQSEKYSHIKEIRSQGEIHAILTQNENRFQNCLKPYRSRSAAKAHRVSVKFEILPSGTVARIEFLQGKENKELNERLKIQLSQLRFSKVDPRFGNQTVYHSFFY